jgi:hypothetical protein
MELKPFKEFKKLLSPRLKHVAPRKPDELLVDIYALAVEKDTLEKHKQVTRELSGYWRTRRTKLKRARAHIQNAVRELLAASPLYESEWEASMTPGPGVSAAQMAEVLNLKSRIDWLEQTAKQIHEVENLYAASIHPALKTRAEVNSPFPALTYDSLFPGMKAAAIDYWFVARLEKLLADLRSQDGSRLRPAVITGIISWTFWAAFGERYEIDRVKTARRRLPKRPLLMSSLQ